MRSLRWAFYIFWASSSMANLYLELSSLEKSLVDKALLAYGLEVEESPENKRIGQIFVFTDQPFEKDAGLLAWLNHLHINTKDYIIRRGIFHKGGDIYESSVIKDSELSLRKRGQVRSIAVIVPVRSKLKGEVNLLVVTKDLLSLVFQFNISGSAANITNLSTTIAENNLLGLNKSTSLGYEMQQGTHLFSGSYFDPSFLSSPLQLYVLESLLFLRDGFLYDGLLTDVRIGKPLFSQTDKWGYGLSIKAGSKTVFDFQGGKLRTYDITTLNSHKSVERTYRYRYGSGSLLGTYSLGTTYKRELSFGYGFNLKNPIIPKNLDLTEEEIQVFKDKLLPRDEIESFISLGFSYFYNQFLTLYDYNNFRVQETLRIGPYFSIGNDFALKPILFSDHNFLRPKLSLSFINPLGSDAFLSTSFSSSIRFDGNFTDTIYRLGLNIVSPKIFQVGRAILSGSLAETFNNRDNQKFVVGSESGLRGVESRFYLGSKGFNANLELRSAPLDIWILHAGLALFYDVGAAFDDWRKVNATHALGFGIRVLAPQISSLPFRFDLAFPIYGIGKKYHSIVPSFGGGQAF